MKVISIALFDKGGSYFMGEPEVTPALPYICILVVCL